MNITSAQYINDTLDETQNSSIKATIDDVEVFVPISEENRHYAAILEWVAKGNTIAEAD